MSVGIIRHQAGTATPCQSGGYLCDLSDSTVTWVPDRDHAKALLASRAIKTTAMRRDLGRVGSAWEAAGPTHGHP